MTFRKCPLRTDVAGAGETSESHAFEAELDRVAGGEQSNSTGPEPPPNFEILVTTDVHR